LAGNVAETFKFINPNLLRFAFYEKLKKHYQSGF